MGSTLSTIIIAVILAIILFFAVKNSIPHFRGEGGCCGGSGKEKTVKPKPIENVIETISEVSNSRIGSKDLSKNEEIKSNIFNNNES